MEELKRAAATKAVDSYVKSGMTVGLGTGSTAFWVVKRLGELLNRGELRDVRGIATSTRPAELAREEGIPLASLSEALDERYKFEEKNSGTGERSSPVRGKRLRYYRRYSA